MLKSVCRTILIILGWKIDYREPKGDRYVIIGAPHTSNWDFPLALLGLYGMGIKFNWVAKHTLFRWPLGILFRAMGGLPVDRSTGTGFLKRILQMFRQRERLVLVIAPEGTRSRTAGWKTGFYVIALKAGVPIVPGYVDYSSKTLGIGGMIMVTGDIEKDFENLAAFYEGIEGRYPEKQSDIRPAKEEKRR